MIAKIRKLIENKRRFLVAAHMNPDGDAISSTLALGNALREMGKEVVFFNGDPVPQVYSFLPGAELLTSSLDQSAEEIYDVGFVLDSGELRRAGEHLRDRCRILVNIDHHVDSERFSDYFWVDEKASSTGTLIYRLLKNFTGYRFSLPVATCLYTSLVSDTGSFRFANTDKETFQIAAELLELGVNPAEISAHIYEDREERVLHLLGLALGTLKLSECGRIASISVTNAHMEATGTGPEHTDGFINYPRSIRGVEIALLFREAEPGFFKVGFRSNGNVDVAFVAQNFGGGGHARAAGATLRGTLDEVREKIIGHISQIIS
ncbi:MAG: bifunctional oligoribonuclease/PAP phosphatase NrnA [Deltaproteobacteria bacterium]|nr:bifunctional oligoribonuclease/PAP phosphatase NrnA [Deltaproteobacteria bacterium]